MPETGWTVADQQLADAMLERMPKHLYRYTRLQDRHEWVREVIVDSIIYFTPPRDFNDPLDCRVEPSFEYSKEEAQRYWFSELRRQFPKEERSAVRTMAREMAKASTKPEGQKKFTDELFKSFDSSGILCLSEAPKDMLMWSYYAHGHRGICYRFRMDPALFLNLTDNPNPLLMDVKYASEFPVVNYFTSTVHEFSQGTLATKSIAWKHEQEWRIILLDKNGKMPFSPAMLDGIILGMRTSKEDERTIRGWIEERDESIPVFRIKHKPRSFELEICPT